MNRENKYRFLSINSIIILIFACYYILPAVSAKYSFFIAIALGLGYVFLTAFQNKMKISTTVVSYIVLIAVIAFLYMILTDASSIASDVTNRGMKRFMSKFYQMGMMFLPILFLKWAVSHASHTEKKIILAVSYFLIIYVIYITMKELIINPDITRAWGEFGESSTNNVANYYFVYAIPFIIALCTMIACRTKKNGIKILLIAAIVLQMYFLLLAQYTLSALISIVGICMEVYINSNRGQKRVALCLGFVLLGIASPWIVRFAASHVPSEQMSIRLYEIYYFLIGGDTTGYNMQGRMTLYIDTVKAFFASPIWGNRSLDFDGHATFLTVLSDLGVLGGVPFYYLYFSSRKKVKKIINDRSRSFKVIFVMLFLMGLTNPIHAALPLMYVVWFLVPLTIKTYQEYEEKKYGVMEN